MSLSAGAQTGEWGWIGGSMAMDSDIGPSGVYGTLGTPASGNIPGSREFSLSWTDKSGNLWLFGGEGLDADGTGGPMDDLWLYNPSSGEWTWMAGSKYSTNGTSPVYGTLGTPAPGNTPSGRYGSVSWIDASGNLWLFGGSGIVGYWNYNDIWEFNPSSSEWTWMGGSNTAVVMANGNYGQAGVYGTLGEPAATNVPGSHWQPANWEDTEGNFWVFGGDDYDSAGNIGFLNDMWRFSPSSREWTWMGGSSTLVPTGNGGGKGPAGAYGTLGTPSTNNIPGGRYDPASWVDSSGTFWLFGGFGYDSAGITGLLNDLWMYNPASGTWTWVAGSNTNPTNCTLRSGHCGQPGVYGSSADSTPGGRQGGVTWTDNSGNLWLFGGAGFDSASVLGYLNDLWMFNPATKQWASMGGNSTVPSFNYGQPAVYGSLGVLAEGNNPGGRWLSTSWADNKGDFWLFGGADDYATPNLGNLNDLWEYKLPQTFTFTASPASLTVSSGSSGTTTLKVTPSNGFNSAVTFACSGVPSGATCSFSPTTVTPSGAAATSQLTIAASQSAAVLRVSPSFFPATALTAAICLFGFRRRRVLQLLAFAFAALAFSAVSACGGGGSGGSPTPTPTPTTSTVTVTATSGALQQSATISLTLN